MTVLDLVQYLGATLGVVGALLVTSQDRTRRRLAFLVWIASNLALVILFIATGMFALVAMQSIYLGTSLLGYLKNTYPKP